MKLDNTFFLIGRVKEHYTAFLEDELKAAGVKGIVTSHADILAVLKQNGELSMSEISAKINRDSSTVTALVAKLAKLGLVTRRKNDDDYRFNLVSLTKKAEDLLPIFRDISERLFQKAQAGISEEDWRRLGAILKKLLDNVT